MKKMVLVAKAQTVDGVDAAPTAAANAILCRGMTPKPIGAEFVDRQLLYAYKGNSGKLAVGVHRAVEFEVEFAGAGAAGTAPKWGPLLQACGFSETITAGASAVYAPISGGEKLMTLYFVIDGVHHKMVDSRGTVSIEMNAKAIPVLKFRFIGEYSAPTDTALSGVSYAGFFQPLTVGKINTPVFSLFGYAAAMNSFSADVANALAYRDLVNGGGASSADRSPSGSAVIEMTTVAQKNWPELVRQGTTGTAQIVHGTVAGQIVQLDMPKIQLTSEPSISDDNKNVMLNLGFDILPVTGNDELIVTVE
jgi:hypothetical protein